MMENKTLLLKALVLLILLLVPVSTVFAGEKDIYVGDLLKVRILNTQFNMQEIKSKFSDFDVDKIRKIDNGYEVWFRSFETGEKTIRIGNKTLRVRVKSLLSKGKNDIMDIRSAHTFAKHNSIDLREPKRPVPYTMLLYLGIVLILGGLGYGIYYYRKRGKISNLSPYEEFLSGITSARGSECFYILTYALKRYLEREYGVKILGKTSQEFMTEVAAIELIKEDLSELREWLEFADMAKYAKMEVAEDVKEARKNALKALVDKWEEKNKSKPSQNSTT